jgi:hypothetical protein
LTHCVNAGGGGGELCYLKRYTIPHVFVYILSGETLFRQLDCQQQGPRSGKNYFAVDVICHLRRERGELHLQSLFPGLIVVRNVHKESELQEMVHVACECRRVHASINTHAARMRVCPSTARWPAGATQHRQQYGWSFPLRQNGVNQRDMRQSCIFTSVVRS